jgi:hypothetical protein
MGRPRKTHDAVERPYVDWEGKKKALTWQLLAQLKEHSSIRRGLWAKRDHTMKRRREGDDVWRKEDKAVAGVEKGKRVGG